MVAVKVAHLKHGASIYLMEALPIKLFLGALGFILSRAENSEQ